MERVLLPHIQWLGQNYGSAAAADIHELYIRGKVNLTLNTQTFA
jgi:hypothetical protein